MKKKTLMWIGGAAVAALAVGGVAYAMTKKPAIPAAPVTPNTPTLTATSVLSAGKNYGFTAQLPATGAADVASLTALLNAAGWQNVQIVYFGPTANGAAPPVAVSGALATAYAASGTWGGADNTPTPAGVSVVQIS
jgi:hypothetical protein